MVTEKKCFAAIFSFYLGKFSHGMQEGLSVRRSLIKRNVAIRRLRWI